LRLTDKENLMELSRNATGLSHILSYARDVARNEGLAWFLKTGVSHLAYFIYYKGIRKNPNYFIFQGQRYSYFTAFYHATYTNERAVEIPIAMNLVSKFRGRRILEVGNVLSHYYPFPHIIVDKYEAGTGVNNEDIVDYKPGEKFDLIISISTFEHVGWDENSQDEKKIPRALANIKNLIKPGGIIMITLPIGQNPTLDRLIRNGSISFDKQCHMRRLSKSNMWTDATWEEVSNAIYGSPFPNANAIIVGYLYG
jgi:SAM-dependent methyltransferase